MQAHASVNEDSKMEKRAFPHSKIPTLKWRKDETLKRIVQLPVEKQAFQSRVSADSKPVGGGGGGGGLGERMESIRNVEPAWFPNSYKHQRET